MDSSARNQTRIVAAAGQYWAEIASRRGAAFATRQLVKAIWEFLRDSMPARVRQRYGDADYDWEYRVNTTGGAVEWRDRLLGAFHSAYQPTDPAEFHEMIQRLQQLAQLNFADFTFVDLGSGKGRTLLMASDYPFLHIVGVELLPSLNEIARQNLSKYKSESQKCFAVESISADATSYSFPNGPSVIYLFNPLRETGLRQVVLNLNESLRVHPRPVYILYHNPEHDQIILESKGLKKIGGTHQYSIFTAES